MRIINHLIFIIAFTLTQYSCVSLSGDRYMDIDSEPPRLEDFSSFADYAQEYSKWISEVRVPVSDSPEAEVSYNSPFIIENTGEKIGILLVHGLRDSPYSFSDISKIFASKNIEVRAIVLPGHGTNPGALLDASYQEWEDYTHKHIEKFSKEIDILYLGGFSTGANIITTLDIENNYENVEALFLFSPAPIPEVNGKWALKIINLFSKWAPIGSSIELNQNKIKYTSVPYRALISYFDSASRSYESIKNTQYEKPVFVVASYEDSVIDIPEFTNLFTSNLINKNNRFILYSENELEFEDSRIKVIKSSIPDEQIINLSHTSIMYDPKNQLLGKEAIFEDCIPNIERNIFGRPSVTPICDDNEKKDIWFGAWGQERDGMKYFNMLLWNPFFEDMKSDLLSYIDTLIA